MMCQMGNLYFLLLNFANLTFQVIEIGNVKPICTYNLVMYTTRDVKIAKLKSIHIRQKRGLLGGLLGTPYIAHPIAFNPFFI